MLSTLADERLSLREIHRFANTPLQAGGSLQWDIAKLFREVKFGLNKAASLGLPIEGISTDSWGVDYVLLDEAGELIPPAFHYRDARTKRGVELARARMSWETIFDETGIQFMPLNTLFQLAAESPERLAHAARLLTIGDAFNHWLGGAACIDQSNASTTQLYNPRTQQWSQKLIHALRLPEKLFPPIVPSGMQIGTLRPNLALETGLPEIPVLASCSHDTAAAVAAVPAEDGDWAYLSSGTWSLMGVELDSPLITDACRELNFTNEIGYGGSGRLLKNISGLWLVQECRRAWAKSGMDFDYATLTHLAERSPPFGPLIDPTNACFLAPPDMPEAITAFCHETGQPTPATPGATIRCALESLALLYRRTRDQIEKLLSRRIERLHIVGGGSQNELLNQFTANALQIPVLAGPAEATAAGNVLVQAIALRHLDSLPAARDAVRRSFEMKAFEPREAAEWDQLYQRFEEFFE